MEQYNLDYFTRSKGDDNISWIDKYSPKHIKDIIGNKYNIDTVVKWLSEFETNKAAVYAQHRKSLKTKQVKKKPKRKSVTDDNDDSDVEIETYSMPVRKKDDKFSNILITGNHGVGKTCSAYVILNDLGYTIYHINFNKIKSIKNIQETLDRIRTNQSVDKIFAQCNNQQYRPVLICDELETLSSQTEKQFVMALLRDNDVYWYFPVIFISNNQHNKLISEIRKNSIEVKMNAPYNEELYILFKRISDAEKIKYNDIDATTGLKHRDYTCSTLIIEHSQNDYRRLVFICEDLKNAYGRVITLDNVREYCNYTKKKDIDYDLYKAAGHMCSHYDNIDSCMRYYETEKVLIPLMLHQNYVKYINTLHKSSPAKKIATAYNISKSVAKADIVENFIYSEQNWDMQEVHGFYACVCPSFYLNEATGSINGNVNNARTMLEFPYDLNRTSIKNINKNNIIKLKAYKQLSDKDINDYMYMTHIVRRKFSNENDVVGINDMIKTLRKYDIKNDNIDALLKIDKIDETKFTMPTKYKNMMRFG